MLSRDAVSGAAEHEPDAPLRRTLGLARPARKRLTLATLLGAATAACGIALLATSAWLIARAAQHPSVVALGVAIIGVRFFAISRGLCRYGERLVGHDAALRVLVQVRVRVFERLERLAPAGLPAFRRGDLLARIVDDVDALQDLMLRAIPPFGIALIAGVPTIAVVWYFLPAAGAVLAVTFLVAATAVPWCTLRLDRRRETRLAAARGALSTDVVDLLEGAAELVAFGAADGQLARIAADDRELTGVATSTAGNAGFGAGLITLLTGLAVCGTLLVGVPAVHSGRLHGPLLAVIALIPLAAFELTVGLPAAAQSLERARQSAARVFDVIDASPVVEEPPGAVPLGPPPHHIEIRRLRVRYAPEALPALDGVALDLPPGRRVAVIGPSGAGKTTLGAVLLRFVDYSGSVTLDGIELAAVEGEDVRRVVGMAAQDAHVFDTTLRENLLVARREASDTDIWTALEQARLADWIRGLPAGLDTEVGEHGAGMSGGQRQRLGIARVLLADFPVLVLDEPGEHLDTATADELTADLLDLTRGRTTVLITHRLAGLDAMDEILVLDAGRVVERGTHTDLLDQGGPYSQQWQRECSVDAQIGVV
jgi:thiol reductant ABC exporter CydC subunit